jgi:23S rRNA (uracil1939-C5)-methyltransferase
MVRMKIEKLVFGGQALGRAQDKVAFVWNALPGEEVEVFVDKNKRNYLEGTAVRVIKPSNDRIAPREGHFLSCSPWQILTPEAEAIWKKKIAVETFLKLGGLELPGELEIVSDGRDYNYRNKMEFFFAPAPQGGVSLAFYKRGTDEFVPVTSCELAKPSINETAKAVLKWVNDNSIPPEILKRVVIRSDEEGRTIAALFAKEEFGFLNYPLTNDVMVGFQMYPQEGRAKATEKLKPTFSQGADFLTANLKDVKLRYGALSFFQINLPVFSIVLDDIARFLDKKKPVVDYYCGAGAISLPLFSYFKECVLIDSSSDSISDARENIKLNGISNCSARVEAVEWATEHLSADNIVIFDPPRAGLHHDVITKVIAEKPLRIIYLSCNLSSQARDIKKLLPFYKVSFLRLYNFFPRTPHIEGLCVLDRTC